MIAILLLTLSPLALPSANAPAPAAATLEVSPDGPLRSLEDARDRIRSLRRAGSTAAFTVRIRGGTYHLARPFELGPEDAGTPAAPVVYSAFPGERVVISGGRVIGGGWTRGTGDVWTKQVPGVAEGEWYFRQLFVNGRRAQRARAPNFGYYRSPGPSSKDKPFRLKFGGADIQKEWQGTGAEAVVLLRWTEIRQPIVGVDDLARIATLSGDAGGTAVGIPEDIDSRYFVENAPGTLDTAGEWYLDRATGRLSYWPVGGEDLASAEIVAPALPQLVRISADAAAGKFVRHVAFRDLHFEHADWELPRQGHSDYPQAAVRVRAAFQAEATEDCAIEACSFQRLGGYAIWFGRGCKRNRIVGNQIADIGAGGIKVGDTEMHDNPAERNVEHVIEDNVIHHLGEVYPEAVAIWIGQSSRNVIAHNTIHDLFYTGISVGWTWGYGPNQCAANRIEFNHIYDVGQYTLNDLGAIYTLGQQPGTVVRNNLIHDVNPYADRGRGIYLDEGSTNVLVENNVVYRCKNAGFHQHYGRDNVVRNNVFACNDEAQFSRAKAEPHRCFTFEKNIVYFDHGTLMGGAWSDTQFLVRDNLYFDARGDEVLFCGASFEQWQKRTGDTDSIVADPLFVNPTRFQFDLHPQSPAHKIGFQPIDLRDVGARQRRP